ncbi:MAG TPA: TatD family hydrolase [Deltaproteobacteria bacterium]|jgi:TatD DNase family protein|nr:TatD family hydrolase [Deltaproteobacteria bacterium]HOI06389.1 TatD family hydrolase [Deltaproteobacteria bacterium]
MRAADSHNHLHFDSYDQDFAQVVDRSFSAGITCMLLVGIDAEDSRRAVKAADTRDGLYASIGIHPQNAGIFSPEDVFSLEGLAGEGKVVAVGETGYDLYRTPESESLQKELFKAHVSLARRLSLPLVIHDRDAHAQTLSLLDECDAWSLGGVFHCYSGDVHMAERVLERGFFISVPGVVTYKTAQVLREVVRMCPMDSLLVETDAPFLSPVPFRGKRNEPSYMVKTIEEMARLKGCTPEDMGRQTLENFTRLFLSKRGTK